MPTVRLHHSVHMVSVDSVDAHSQQRLDAVILLGIPRKSKDPEAMGQSGEAACPLLLGQIDRIDAVFGEPCAPTFHTFGDFL